MAILKDKLFLKRADFDDYKDLSANFDLKNYKMAVREAQVIELTGFLGRELYLLLQNDYVEKSDTFATAKYSELWFGEDYASKGKTVRYHGLQPAVALYAYARMLNSAQLKLTRSGAVSFGDEDVSEATPQAQIKSKVIEARSMAVYYMEEAKQYLLDKRSSYPEQLNDGSRNRTLFMEKVDNNRARDIYKYDKHGHIQ